MRSFNTHKVRVWFKDNYYEKIFDDGLPGNYIIVDVSSYGYLRDGVYRFVDSLNYMSTCGMRFVRLNGKDVRLDQIMCVEPIEEND